MLQQCLPLEVLKPYSSRSWYPTLKKLQQCLPLAVLKQGNLLETIQYFSSCNSAYRLRYWNSRMSGWRLYCHNVAIVLTACSIETPCLKLSQDICWKLQQCLPLTVLKLFFFVWATIFDHPSCNSAYRLRYAMKGERQQRSKATMRSAHL